MIVPRLLAFTQIWKTREMGVAKWSV